ncbi:MAG TPA: hypothetical protein VFZ64_01265 [Nocardioidaceae bacterium]
MIPTSRDRVLNLTCGTFAAVLVPAGLVTALVMGLIALYVTALGGPAWAALFWSAAVLSAIAPFLFLHSYDEWQKKKGLPR